MVRSILAVLAGVVAATIVIIAIQMVSMVVYPLPEGLKLDDRDAMKAYLDSMPASAWLLLLFGYFAGTFCGAALAVYLARRAPVVHAGIVCGVFMLGNLLNLLTLPHPMWYWWVSFATFPLAAATALAVRSPAKPLAA
jgi:hypothetical protein